MTRVQIVNFRSFGPSWVASPTIQSLKSWLSIVHLLTAYAANSPWSIGTIRLLVLRYKNGFQSRLWADHTSQLNLGKPLYLRWVLLFVVPTALTSLASKMFGHSRPEARSFTKSKSKRGSNYDSCGTQHLKSSLTECLSPTLTQSVPLLRTASIHWNIRFRLPVGPTLNIDRQQPTESNSLLKSRHTSTCFPGPIFGRRHPRDTGGWWDGTCFYEAVVSWAEQLGTQLGTGSYGPESNSPSPQAGY